MQAPRTTVRLPYRWGVDESWRDNYVAIREADLDLLPRQGKERRVLRCELRIEAESASG